jgi:predicted ribosome quality control (RQC) complex YloA/Tae2 family protein
MAALDPINNAFDKKIQSLEATMNKLKSLVGTDPPKGMTSLAIMEIVENILDLYEIDREIYFIMSQLRNEFVNVFQQEGQIQNNLEQQVKDLEQRFKNTFGSLENTLNKINEKDKGDNSFYG